jgi:hypothetical protein
MPKRAKTNPEEPNAQGASALALAVIELAPIGAGIEPTREGYTAAIHTFCRKSAVAVGKILIDAKEGPNKLPYGTFMAMIEEDLPFGPRTAEKLMVIGRNEVLSK